MAEYDDPELAAIAASEPKEEPKKKVKTEGESGDEEEEENKGDQQRLDFAWCRGRTYDKFTTMLLLEKVKAAKTAKVISITGSKKTKKKPIPLNTIELQKLVSKKLKIGSAKCMEICEKLY